MKFSLLIGLIVLCATVGIAVGQKYAKKELLPFNEAFGYDVPSRERTLGGAVRAANRAYRQMVYYYLYYHGG